MDEQRIAWLKELLEIHRKNQRILEIRKARAGGSLPLEDHHQLEDTLAEIKRIEAQLASEEEGIFDALLTHLHTEAECVEELARRLEDDAQLRVLLDRWICVSGGQWQREMARGHPQAKSCVVCIGEQTPEGWLAEQIQRALDFRIKNPSFRVIPLLLPNAQTVNVDDFFELRTWVDFQNGLDDRRAFHILVSGIRGVIPDRGPMEEVPLEWPRTTVQVWKNLRLIAELRGERLIDDAIALEYQRKTLDRLLGR